jgi:uncharacterized membrane protein YgcG
MNMSVRSVLGAATALTAAVLIGALSSPASAAPQSSVNVAVIPGFTPPIYSGTFGVPNFPTTAPGLSAYHFSQLSASGVTSAALQSYDTVILYGLRWGTLSPSAQAAINSFASTGKVVIWDADSTGAQDYSSFVHPFSTTASGESGVKAGSVVTFIANENPLASSDPSSPLYLDPSSLVASTHLIGHMSVLNTGAAEWAPGLIAANPQIPDGGWALAWGYGKTGDHSGMVVYSGIDADAFNDSFSPNYALKELGIDLAAGFLRTADTACAPTCSAPSVGATGGGGTGGGGTGGGGTGGGGTGGGGTGGGGGQTSFAQCSLDRKAPASWVRGQIALYLKTSSASNLSVRTVTRSGKVVGTTVTLKPGHLKILVNTKRLPSNRVSNVFAVVYVSGAAACRVSVGLKVDNTPPRLLRVKAKRTLAASVLSFGVTEASSLTIISGGHTQHLKVVPHKTIVISLPAGAGSAKLVLVDRAGNKSTRLVAWA